MKRFILSLLVLFAITMPLSAQNNPQSETDRVIPLNLKARVLRKFGNFNKDSLINIVGAHFYYAEETSPSGISSIVHCFKLIADTGEEIEVSERNNERVEYQSQTLSDFWNVLTITEVMPMVYDYGLQYDLRRQMEFEALEYIHKMQRLDVVFEDPLIEAYIMDLMHKIMPTPLPDGRPSNLNLLMVQNSEPNASM